VTTRPITAASPLSIEMAVCLAHAYEHRKLVRYVGGYWAEPNAPRRADGIPVDYFTTPTIQGLIRRERLEYVEWKEGRGGRFPIAVMPKAEAVAA
jgi:hypothetical protein